MKEVPDTLITMYMLTELTIFDFTVLLKGICHAAQCRLCSVAVCELYSEHGRITLVTKKMYLENVREHAIQKYNTHTYCGLRPPSWLQSNHEAAHAYHHGGMGRRKI